MSNKRSCVRPSYGWRDLTEPDQITLVEVRRSAVSRRHALLYFKIPYCVYTEQIKYNQASVPNFTGCSYNSLDESITVCVEITDRINSPIRSYVGLQRLADGHRDYYINILNRIYRG